MSRITLISLVVKLSTLDFQIRAKISRRFPMSVKNPRQCEITNSKSSCNVCSDNCWVRKPAHG